MLYECAAHGTRVSSLEVLYIGWKAYGTFVQRFPLGSNLTCPKSFEMLAVIEPERCVVVSVSTTWNPSDVSCMATWIESPEFMNKSRFGSGVYVANVASTGLAGAWAAPLFVTNAKFTGSMPTWAKHAGLLAWPVFAFADRLSMVSAAHHWAASQESPGG